MSKNSQPLPKPTAAETAANLEIVAGLAAIQAARIAHDKQTKDQTKPVVDILDKAAKP